MRQTAFVFILGLILAATGCVGTGLDPNGNPIDIGEGGGSGGGVSFAADVQPIFTASCAFIQCHAGPAPQENQNLSAGLAYASIVNVAANEHPTMRRIRPFIPDSSYLVHKIQGTHLQVGGSGGRMPLGGTLDQSDINVIRAWVEAGAPNN